ncbi:hypothetical protein SKAU_G00382270 [Synaphobranchus kaupii]|uniref:Uncharacterized protein n=1 Tax=Synaphobranchus kaupii TaxID=118154 RepID=A0A9Q1IES6_SYNKA|nr:hypothetical protein SKAU_G00382270 [Synaphobranchus kaupii]
MEEGNISGANSSEKASEEVNGESDRRQAGETVLNERCGEEGAVSEVQEADIDDPQEGTSASTVRPRSAERSGRTKERGKVGRVRRPWGEMEQSNERGKDGKGDGCTPAKEVCGPAMETIGLSSSVEADTAVAEEGAEVEMVDVESGLNRGPSSVQEEEEEEEEGEGELSDSSEVSDITASQAAQAENNPEPPTKPHVISHNPQSFLPPDTS